MKLSANTVKILKNFAEINSGLIVKPGHVIKTMSISKSLFAEATIAEEFPREFALYDLPKLLNVLSLHTESDIEFDEHHLTLHGLDGRSKTIIRYSPANVVRGPVGYKSPKAEFAISFDLSDLDLKWISNLRSILKAPNLMFTNENKKVVISALDEKDEVVDRASVQVATIDVDTPFKFVFKVDNLKLLPDSYTVQIGSAGVNMAQFTGKTNAVNYFVAVEKGASYG